MAGIVALILEDNSDYSPDEVLSVLKSTAEDLGFHVDRQGAGLVDAEEVVLVTE